MKKFSFRSKSFKYGAASGVFTVAFIAVVIVFNMILSALANKYMWYFDMTSDKVFTLSDKAKEIVSDVSAEVNIYFASEPDVLMTGTYARYTRYIYTTALQLEEEFPNIHVECVSVLKNPSFFRRFYNMTSSSIEPTSVIIESGGEVRVFAFAAFFSADDTSDISTIWAYNGEKRLISGIMQVTQTKTPKVLFTTAHGEGLENAVSLAALFDENGYDVSKVDLSTDEIDEDCRIIVVFDPIYDFIGAEAEDMSKNEIEKIDKFLDNYGCLLVFGDPEHAENLTNLNELLAEWGISFVSGSTVRDMAHSMSTDGYSIVAEYQQNTLGSSVYSDLNNLSAPPKTVIRKAMPIEITWQTGISANGERTASPVLRSYGGAELMRDGTATETGAYDIVVMARQTRIVNSEYYYSYVFAVGSPTFAQKSYLESSSYANEDILASVVKAAGRERVLAVLDRKPLDDSKITVTTADANRLTVAMTLVLPAVFAVCGAVVLIRRKHS